MTTSGRYLETAIEAARIGGGILIEYLNSATQKEAIAKQAFDFVTEVDHTSEKQITDFLMRRHPDHSILAEEAGKTSRDSDFRWIIDPLDGTKNYIHGFPFFSVSVALQHEDTIIAGAIYDPLRQELFAAEKKGGAFLNGESIHVSQTTELSHCLVATGFPFRNKALTQTYFQAFSALFEDISDMRRAGSAAIDLAYVACGRLDGFWELNLNLWDIAAGTLLIEEAGGKVSDFWDGDTHHEHGHIIASNGRIHSAISERIGPFFDLSQL